MTGYLFITIAAVLFSVQFIFSKKYQTVMNEQRGASFLYNAVAPIAYTVLLLCSERFSLQINLFAVTTAVLWAIVYNACTYFSLKALAAGSIVNYSLWLMSGGMILPFLYGVLFRNDPLTVFRVIGVIIVGSAVIVKADFREKINAKALLCFILLFISNGLVGVISSVYQSDLFPYERIPVQQFSILCNAFSAVGGALLFLQCILRERKHANNAQQHIPRMPMKRYGLSITWATLGGVCNGAANLLLLFALQTVNPSLQYPMITGGCIFLSGFSGLLFKEKSGIRGWCAVALALLGTVIMIF